MSSDKRKGSAPKAKALSKQRTLLDSFVTRVPSKPVLLELEPVEVTPMHPSATTCLQPGGGSSIPIDSEFPVRAEKEALRPSTDLSGSPSLEENDRRSPSIVLLEDTPELHPTVSQRTPVIDLEACLEEEGGKLNHRPIFIDLPLKSSERRQKQIHPFFLPKSTRPVQTQFVPSRKQTRVTPMPPNASLFYPRGIPQHVTGSQTTFTCESSPLARRPHKIFEEATDRVVNYDFLESPATIKEPSPLSHRVQLVPIHAKDPADDIPEDIKASHPAVARLLDLKPADKPTSNRPWADSWRPSCAQEVLGNEQSAIYLRDWLHALELQLEGNGVNLVPTDSSQDHKKAKANGKTITRGIKRPRVIRAVDKTRRKRSRLDSDEEENNWLVYSDEEDALVDYDQFDEFGEIIMDDPPASSPSSSVHELSQEVHEKPSDLGQLHNTILLTGPSGCGKTASVYACAEELGWDIFEVYPGIGRRNGTNIDNLIGEVGKNHLVMQSRTSGDSLKPFLQSKAKRKPVEDDEECNALSQISPRRKGAIKGVPPQDKQDTKSVQQSLILLEEVDILFKEDSNFWSTVTRIIRECKRPVVCTCNDLSLVPVQELPLQATLFYAPCPERPAACYLQALCGAEGYGVSLKDLLTLYSEPQGAFNHTPDLRATINALQVISANATEARAGQQESSSSALDSGRISVVGSEFLSFLDGSLDGNIGSIYSALTDICNHVPSDDDETGHMILFDRHAEDSTPFEIYDRQSQIVSAAAQLVSPVFGMDMRREESGGKREEKIREGQRVAAREICRIGEATGSVVLEYLPYVRQIVEAEDKLEEKERRGAVRRTRNSTRRQYVRMVELTEHARASRDPPTMATRDSSSKHSLASLEYLQTHRRGSITDPFLHAAQVAKQPSSLRSSHDLTSSSSSSHHLDSSFDRELPEPRPMSPYTFGNATPRPHELRKLLHSPPRDHPSHRPTNRDSPDSSRTRSGPSVYAKESDFMNVDADIHPRRGIRDPPSFDFSMRRHSIAVGQNTTPLSHLSPPLHGTKRKVSDDRATFPPVGEDVDPQLVGPGIPRDMDVDHDAPPLKRRGSTIDTQRIAQLSLNDRRNSVDSRSNWLGERRDSAPSLLPSVPGISSFTSNHTHSELPHARIPPPLASLSWSPNASEPSGISNGTTYGTRQFDPIHPISLAPPSGFLPDRRMSVPDILSHASTSRPLRPRSRPPSRQNTDPHSGPPSGQDEPSSGASTAHNVTAGKLSKETGSTPYSRSPELRVSHKLAERKRRKEMKDLFDELRDQLPADRGMKASKWEILSKAIDFIMQLKRSHQEMAAELDMLRAQVRGSRPEGLSGYPSGPSHTIYSGGPPILPSYPLPPLVPPPHHVSGSHAQTHNSTTSGPEPSQNILPAPLKSSTQTTNGSEHE